MRTSRIYALLLMAASSLAQTPSAGEKALASQDWTAAELSFRQSLQESPDNGQAWFGLGDALYGEQRFAEAAQDYQHAASLNFQTMRSLFRQAKSLARAGSKDEAFAVLGKLNQQGFPNINGLTSDADFKSLQTDSRWQSVISAATANATPCEHSVQNRQFDFWIGEWHVETTSGQPAGTSKVERILNGCALLENWSGGGDGKSLNIYNANKKQWQQFWVDSGGEVHEYSGGLVNGEMKFEGPAADRGGNRTLRRMTFTPLEGGKVRQRGEVSADGTTWTVEYVLIYVPKQ